MLLEALIIAVAGFAAAGAMRALGLFTAGDLPRWLVPAAAVLAMLAAAISSDYLWFARTRDNLPDGVILVSAAQTPVPYLPWTYVVPVTNRFVALDTRTLEKTADPATYNATLFLLAHWASVQSERMLVDCATSRRAAPPRDGAEPDWGDTDPDDPIVATVCAQV